MASIRGEQKRAGAVTGSADAQAGAPADAAVDLSADAQAAGSVDALAGGDTPARGKARVRASAGAATTAEGVATAPAPAKGRGRPSSRDRIVAAAVDLIGEVGASHLSLEAVAERAGISKGGLLYNFPTKTDLLKALVASHIIELDIRRADAEAALGDAPNRAACAFVAAAAADLTCKARPPSGFLAAIAENPDLLDPLRARNRALADRFRTAGDPCLSLIAFLAVEGMKTADLFETNPLTGDERAAVLQRLEDLLGACVPARTGEGWRDAE